MSTSPTRVRANTDSRPQSRAMGFFLLVALLSPAAFAADDDADEFFAGAPSCWELGRTDSAEYCADMPEVRDAVSETEAEEAAEVAPQPQTEENPNE